MQKKSLDNNINATEFNKKLFAKSVQLITSCKKIPLSQVSNMHREPGIKEKYLALEQKLHNMLKILQNFTDTEKPIFNNPIDLASDILEQTKLHIDVKLRKMEEERNTVKFAKKQVGLKKDRPQELYKNIQPFDNFDEHSHQNYIQDGIIPPIQQCNVIGAPSDISNDFFYVDTVQKLNIAVQQLKGFQQIAVDVEHSQKSYEGFTCFIQISTRVKDYLIDVFPIWSSVPSLQQIIGNPRILKVMHGAEMDTKWLQRDFNIHIVNLFDTHKASRVLGMPKFSYAYLLNHYCNVNTNKLYQRADWRERPLSPEMLKYARIDTHYLLTIYDYLRQDLQRQSKSLNLNFREVLNDIQKCSHQVTLANAELFSYKTKETYVTLQYDFQNKREEFECIQTIYSQINQAARISDECFQDLISRNDLTLILSLVKDLAFNKKPRISKQGRIQKIVDTLEKIDTGHLKQPIKVIKQKLEIVFSSKSQRIKQSVKSEEAAVPVKRQEKIIQKQSNQLFELTQQFERLPSTVKFQPLTFQTFNECTSSKTEKARVNFSPMHNFLAAKYGIEQKGSENQMKQQNQISDQELAEQIQKLEQEEEEQQNGVIQFTRIKPNVVYTVQQNDPEIEALKTEKPRKMRKENEYENRLRNKTGNIFDLLGDV